MKSIETSGKTVEDAVKAGLKELGADIADVTIDVVDHGSPGLFGMFGRLAKIRITVKEEDKSLDFEMPEMTLRSAPAKTAKPAPVKAAAPAKSRIEEKAAPVMAEAPAKPVEAKPEIEKPAAEEKAASQVEKKMPARPAPRPKTEIMENPPPQDPDSLSEISRNAYDFLKVVTTQMGVNVEIYVEETDGHLSIQMLGDTLGILIGRRGETLDALQYLTSLQVNKHRDEYMRVSLDTEHYRAKREEALAKLAARMAMRARKTGRRVTLEPMNPYERRVLHSALQNDPYVTTHSEGEEPYRRVVITLK